MRKLVKLLTITTIASSAALQVTACKDNSKYDSFINEINQSAKSGTAFFGFLGSADDETSSTLQTCFDIFNEKKENNKTVWQNRIEKEWMKELDSKKIKTIYLSYYQGPYHQDKPSDIINSFWNDKSISWQKNIFAWIYNNTKTEKNPDFQNPHGVEEIITKKDDSKEKKDMFTKLPIVFLVSKGKLITAGQNWINTTKPEEQYKAIKEFVQANLFLPNK